MQIFGVAAQEDLAMFCAACPDLHFHRVSLVHEMQAAEAAAAH